MREYDESVNPFFDLKYSVESVVAWDMAAVGYIRCRFQRLGVTLQASRTEPKHEEIAVVHVVEYCLKCRIGDLQLWVPQSAKRAEMIIGQSILVGPL